MTPIPVTSPFPGRACAPAVARVPCRGAALDGPEGLAYRA